MHKTVAQDLPRHLAAVEDVTEDARSASDHASEIAGLAVRCLAGRPNKPVLRPLARLDVEQARKFLMELDAAVTSSRPLLAMFLLGRCAEHAQALLDVIDATVTP